MCTNVENVMSKKIRCIVFSVIEAYDLIRLGASGVSKFPLLQRMFIKFTTGLSFHAADSKFKSAELQWPEKRGKKWNVPCQRLSLPTIVEIKEYFEDLEVQSNRHKDFCTKMERYNELRPGWVDTWLVDFSTDRKSSWLNLN